MNPLSLLPTGDGITLIRPSGQELSFRIGDIVKAEIIEVMGDRNAVLSINGKLISAKTEVPLEPNETVYFKVLGKEMTTTGQELRFQFLGRAEDFRTVPSPEKPDLSELTALSRELKSMVPSGNPGDNELPAARSDTSFTRAGTDSVRTEPSRAHDPLLRADAETLPERILKSLPAESSSIPKDIKTQLQEYLQNSLKATGQSFQARLESLSGMTIPQAVKNDPLFANLLFVAKGVALDIQKMTENPLRLGEAVRNTGIGYEAKLGEIALIRTERMDTSPSSRPVTFPSSKLVASPSPGPVSELPDGELPVTPADGELATFLALQSVTGKPVSMPVVSTENKDFQLMKSLLGFSSQTTEPNGKDSPILQRNVPREQGELSPETVRRIISSETTLPGSSTSYDIGEKSPLPHDPTGKPQGQEAEARTHSERTAGDARHEKAPSLPPSIGRDLKESLLSVKQSLSDKAPELLRGMTEHDVGQLRAFQQNVDGMLRDIETFQALSKITDSFYTFLPLDWKELKEGDIAFKKGEESESGTSSYSCRVKLDLDQAGELTVLVLMFRGDFYVSFKAEKKSFQNVLEAGVGDLRHNFAGQGLRLKGVNVLGGDDPAFGKLENLESVTNLVNIRT